MNRQITLGIIFLLAGLLLCVAIVGLGLRFTLPRPEWIRIGALMDFRPSEQPYEIFDPVHVFVVNDGDQVLVLEPLNQANGGVRVRWWDQEGAFIDPMRGTWFDLQGMPRRGPTEYVPVEDHSLARYRLKLENGLIIIDRTTLSSIPAR